MRTFPPLPMGEVALPSLERAALLLDLDGTLLDIAPAPDAVVVAPGLVQSLDQARRLLGGALAVITGRPIADVDRLLPGVAYAVAGEHGGAIRHAPGTPAERPDLPELPAAWIAEAAQLAAAHPGVLFERKPRGFTLHYRAAPEYRDVLRRGLERRLGTEGAHFALLPAHMAWEVRPRGVDKGTAVSRLMARPPFAGRLPVFAGDDVTDEDAISAAQLAGGVGLRVAETFRDPAGVRAWLCALARQPTGETER